MARNINVQDGIFMRHLKERTWMAVRLCVDADELEGRISRFDRYTIVLDTGDREVLIYKHAIAMIEESQSAAGQSSRPSAARPSARRHSARRHLVHA